MVDAFVRIVSQADAKGEFLSQAQLNTIRKMVNQGNKRLDLVNYITVNAPAIYTNARANASCQQEPLNVNESQNNRINAHLLTRFQAMA